MSRVYVATHEMFGEFTFVLIASKKIQLLSLKNPFVEY